MAFRLWIERRRPTPLPRLFSSYPPEDKDKEPQASKLSSHFSDVKATLKNHHAGDNPLRRTTMNRPSFLSRPQGQQTSQVHLEEVRKKLSLFRPAAGTPPPHSAPSFQRAYQQNDLENRDNSDSRRNAMQISMEKIKESLRGISGRVNVNAEGRNGMGSSGGYRMSLSRFTETLGLKPEEVNKAASGRIDGVGGKEGNLPLEIFGKEIKEKKEGKAGKQYDRLEKTGFLKSYEYEELGEKLRMLRNPADGGMKELSLEELNDRLVKLKEMEKKAKESNSGVHWYDLRNTLMNIKITEEEKEKKTLHRLEILGSLGATPNYMHHPPKEHLFEKYLHPDNMSSAEKLKIQLAKSREEFKMSESDCGSSRVQVAQLTTKIKHLSSVLHKKDKHSRKGLEEMVQRRKQLLKYLRRTDWDSYTMVLSRLGLRDNVEQRR